MRNRHLLTIIIIAAMIELTGLIHHLQAQTGEASSTPDSLKSSIEQKTKELQEINKQIHATQQSIQSAKSQSSSLQKDVSKLNGNIKDLNLRLKASEITTDKLGLELQGLNIETVDIKSSIDSKKEVVAMSLRLVQQKDNEGALITLLRTQSLADSLLEVQNLSDLNSSLSDVIINLIALNNKLTQKIGETEDKQTQISKEQLNVKNRKIIIEDQKGEREKLLGLTKAQQKIYEDQLSKLERQQADAAAAIDKLDTELRKNFNESVLPDKRTGVLIMPVAGKITQYFGEMSNLYRGKPHNGLDIGAPAGTEIHAARDGKVVAAGNNGHLQYGKYVLIQHDNGLSTLYAHMSRQVATTGQAVKRGDIIGYVGDTGYSFGNHLHLGVYYCGPSGWLPGVPRDSQLCGFANIPGAGPVPVGVVVNALDYI